MKIIPVGSKSKANELWKEKLPVLAIDLGFAATARSCGTSHSEKGMTFVDAVKHTQNWSERLGESAKNAAVLILEAPLSAVFQGGNPAARGDFETMDANGNPSDRRWHIGAGGAMALAAIHFLSSLHHLNRKVNGTVWLIEGFVSRYQQGERPTHAQVAKALARVWCTGAWRTDESLLHVIPENLTALSSLSFLEDGEKEGVPVILRLPDGLSRNGIDSRWT